MEVEKQIREIIEFYCGGTYENRNTATKEILQICQNLQLQQTGVSGRSEQFYCNQDDGEYNNNPCSKQCNFCKEAESFK